MALKLYRRHRKKCEAGHFEDSRSGEFRRGGAGAGRSAPARFTSQERWAGSSIASKPVIELAWGKSSDRNLGGGRFLGWQDPNAIRSRSFWYSHSRPRHDCRCYRRILHLSERHANRSCDVATIRDLHEPTDRFRRCSRLCNSCSVSAQQHSQPDGFVVWAFI